MWASQNCEELEFAFWFKKRKPRCKELSPKTTVNKIKPRFEASWMSGAKALTSLLTDTTLWHLHFHLFRVQGVQNPHVDSWTLKWLHNSSQYMDSYHRDWEAQEQKEGLPSCQSPNQALHSVWPWPYLTPGDGQRKAQFQDCPWPVQWPWVCPFIYPSFRFSQVKWKGFH